MGFNSGFKGLNEFRVACGFVPKTTGEDDGRHNKFCLPRPIITDNSSWTAWPLKTGKVCCPEMSVTIYQPTLRKVPEKRRPQLHTSLNPNNLSSFKNVFKNYSTYWYKTYTIGGASKIVVRSERWVTNDYVWFAYHMSESNWETLSQRRKIARICALIKAYSDERAWKFIGDRLQRPSYLSRIDHDWKIRNRRQRTNIRKYSFVNRTIRLWNRLPAEILGTLPCKTSAFRKRVRKVINVVN